MKRLVVHNPRLRMALAWAGLLIATVILFKWVEPAMFESPYNNF
jgi:hypothetical protein